MSLEEDRSLSKDSRAYLQTKLVYAHVLKLCGNRKDAALIEADARTKLVHMTASKVTVSAESLAGEPP